MKADLLHFAPDPSMRKHSEEFININYVSADIKEGVAMKSMFWASSLICSISLPHLSQADIYTGVFSRLNGSYANVMP